MKEYKISFEFPISGTRWSRKRITMLSISEEGALAQLDSLYPYVRDIKIISEKAWKRVRNI